MARKLRFEFEGACYHVITRGNYRRDLFAKEGTVVSFEGTLFEACERFGWRLHACVVMRNHFQVAMKTPQPNLSVGMKLAAGYVPDALQPFLRRERASVSGTVQGTARRARPCACAGRE